MPTLRSYITGFVLSLVLTIAAPLIIYVHVSSGHVFPTHGQMAAVFVLLALAQLVVQMFFFLHVGPHQPKWNAGALLLALFFVITIVVGTLWIMQNLALNHATHTQPFIGGVVSPQTEND